MAMKCKHLNIESKIDAGHSNTIKCLNCTLQGNDPDNLGRKAHFLRLISIPDRNTREEFWPNGNDETTFGEVIIIKI